MLCSYATPALAQAREPWTIVLMHDNDSFLDADRHYTAGDYASATSGKRSDCGFCETIAAIAMLRPDAGTPEYRYGFFLGQSIFTPENLSLSKPSPSDRPYAGWLFLGGRIFRESGNVLDRAEMNIGVVGPGSAADAVQRYWHALHWFGGVPPQGWHTQIKDEPALVLSEQRIWRATLSDDPIGVELLPEANASLGNVFTYAGAGITLRVGQQLDADWGPARIAPAMEGSDFVDFNRIDGIAWNIFAGIEGRLVARNITLDGNAFQDSASVAKIPVVGDVNAGAAFLFNRMRISMSFTFRSPEFKTQQGNDNFGSVAISYSY